jgi:hypothetical protein
MATDTGAADVKRIASEIDQLNETVAALTMNIDPANLPLLNDRLTQLRLRRQTLEVELRAARQASIEPDTDEMADWARDQLTNLKAAMDGVRTDKTREAIATYVDKIVVWPSQKRGEMHLNPNARSLWKRHDRPKGRSWCKLVGAAGTRWNR